MGTDADCERLWSVFRYGPSRRRESTAPHAIRQQLRRLHRRPHANTALLARSNLDTSRSTVPCSKSAADRSLLYRVLEAVRCTSPIGPGSTVPISLSALQLP